MDNEKIADEIAYAVNHEAGCSEANDDDLMQKFIEERLDELWPENKAN